MAELKVYEIEPQQVMVESRHRKHFDRKKLGELTESIRSHGQLQPGFCRKVDGRIFLIFGERRLRACGELGISFLYILKEDITDKLTLKEIELTENIDREDLTWQERVAAVDELHALYEERNAADPKGVGEWSFRRSAAKMSRALGTVQSDVEVATFAKHIPEVAKAKSKSEAQKIIARLNDTVDRREKLNEALAKSRAPSSAIKDESLQPAAKSSGNTANDMLVEYNRRCVLGTLEDKASAFQEDSFDLVFFDPPWGVDFKGVANSTQAYEDKEDMVWERMAGWISTIWGLMKPNSHLYMVFGIVHHERVYSMLAKQGFETNRMPIFWKKKGAHRVRLHKIWPGRCYEAIAYARKGSKDLAQFGRPDIIETSMPTPKMKLSHPSAKHPDLIRDLLMRSCTPGEMVLDPMCGSGMFGVAAESLRKELALDWFQIEMNENFRDLSLYNATRGYLTIIGEKEDPDELSEDYKNLIPGTPEWRGYWDAHPEVQDHMVEWMDKMKGGK